MSPALIPHNHLLFSWIVGDAIPNRLGPVRLEPTSFVVTFQFLENCLHRHTFASRLGRLDQLSDCGRQNCLPDWTKEQMAFVIRRIGGRKFPPTFYIIRARCNFATL